MAPKKTLAPGPSDPGTPSKKAKLGDTKKAATWEWKDGTTWKAYAPEDMELLEHLFAAVGAKGKVTTKDFSFNKGHDTMYELDFSKMRQLNQQSKKSREIRRVGDTIATVKKAVWEWWSDSDEWEPYTPEDSIVLETAYQAGSTPFCTKDLTWNKGYDSLYIFDFTVMTQVNCDSKTSRKIQRTAAGGSKVFGHTEGEDDGYAGALGFLSSGADTTGSVFFAKKFEPSIAPSVVAAQQKKGPQSLRKQAKNYGPIISKDEHGTKCFDEMLKNEKEFCGEWVVFYHSYSSAALLYEVQATVASVLFRFKSEFASLPRLLCAPFHHIPTAKRMLEEFPKWKDRDHNTAFRLVGLCGTSSLLAPDSEAPPKSVFLAGYSVGPLTGVLERLLESCGVPKGKISSLATQIQTLANKHGLDTRGMPGGKKCKSGRSGHMLQIFLRRELCDEYVYPAFPFGVPDKKRDLPFSKYLEQDSPIKGQVRITFNPDVFLRATTSRLFTFSADPTFHENRPALQADLRKLLDPVIGSEEVREKAARGIFGGEPPEWWSSEDQSGLAKMAKSRYASSSL